MDNSTNNTIGGQSNLSNNIRRSIKRNQQTKLLYSPNMRVQRTTRGTFLEIDMPQVSGSVGGESQPNKWW